MSKNKSLKKAILLSILFLFAILVIFIISYNQAIEKPLKSNENTVIIEVKQGEGFYELLNELDNEKKLSSKFLLRLKLSIDKRNIELKEGIYEIDTNTTFENLISSL